MSILAFASALFVLQPADLVIENARIWSDGLPTFAEFAAVKDGRFVYVGDHRPDYVGSNTERVNAQGRVVLPGLIDSHTHMLSGGLNLARVNLRDAKDKAEFVQRVADYAKTLKPGQWVLGGRYSVESWAKPENPTKEWVDPVTGERPLWLSRMDGHSGLANSAALKIAGVTKDTKNPAGGVIDKDPETGEPTGILRETAMGLVTRHIPDVSREEMLGALKKAMAEANRNGITAVSDIPGASLTEARAFEELARDAVLTVRWSLYPRFADIARSADAIKAFKGMPGWMEIRGFKAVMDGSLGSRTALMREPFADNEPRNKDWRGLPLPNMLDGPFEANCRAAAPIGMQAICHAIGDDANHQLLNILERAYGPRLASARCRSEHAQHLLSSDIPRFGRLGVIASMQPLHKADDARYCEARIGVERSRSSYAYKSLLDTGAVVAFGSDWPVVSINPFLGIEAAVTGMTLDGRFWMTQENITVAEALRCYTSRAAYAMFWENEIGKIAPGYRADFLVLNESPFDPNPKWDRIRPVEVWVEGKMVATTKT